ncbi:MAG: DUF1819 family protein [Chromatiaceae bacterium]|nr:DUF1819 family protein [Chromatiaceae bacterium]
MTSAHTLRQASHDLGPLSFTLGGLFLPETLALAAMISPERDGQQPDWRQLRMLAGEADFLGARRASSTSRVLSEIFKRLRTLDQEELDRLRNGSRSDQQALLWIACCRAYGILGAFAAAVLSERLHSARRWISPRDFAAFLDDQATLVPGGRLAHLTDSTRQRLSSVAIRMLREAGGLDFQGQLQTMPISAALHGLLRAQHPADLRYLPGSGA